MTITIQEGRQVWDILSVLSVVGEFPFRSLHLIGGDSIYQKIYKYLIKQTYRNPETGEELTVKLLTVSGNGEQKTVRLFKRAIPLLDWLGAKEYYMQVYQNHKFSGGYNHIVRNHRAAEAVAMIKRLGLEYRPYVESGCENMQSGALYFSARQIKTTPSDELNKIVFTAILGALFVGNTGYAVYNTRNSVMKWNGLGEFKALYSLKEFARFYTKACVMDSAILFGVTETKALQTMLDSSEHNKADFMFNAVYRNVHFVPLDENGVRLLRILLVCDWRERLLSALFLDDTRSYDAGQFDYDAKENGVYYISYFEGNIARLLRFREAVRILKCRFSVLCFPFQVPFIKEVFGGEIDVRTIELDAIEEELGIKEGI